GSRPRKRRTGERRWSGVANGSDGEMVTPRRYPARSRPLSSPGTAPVDKYSGLWIAAETVGRSPRMGVVTMTEPITHPDLGQPWTIEDLAKLPDDGMRYEIVDGSLLVSPMAGRRHVRAATLLRRLLDRQTPPDLTTVQEGGVNVQRRRSYFVPDLFVTRLDTFDEGDDDSFDQSEVLLAVEVLSPSNRGND